MHLKIRDHLNLFYARIQSVLSAGWEIQTEKHFKPNFYMGISYKVLPAPQKARSAYNDQ